MAITLLSSTPAQGSTDNFINKSIELTFSKAIATSSLVGSIFSLIEIDSGVIIPCTIGAGYVNSAKVVLSPSTYLKENTDYRIIVVGTDQALGYSLVAQDADTLTDTLTFDFSTGDSVYKIDSTVEKEAANLALEGDLFLPTNIKALGEDFTVDKVRPKNNKHGVSPSLAGDNTIQFTFTETLLTGVDVTEWIDVNLFPLLNTASYLASGAQLGTFDIPAYSTYVSGQNLVVAFSGELPKNLGVQISLTKDITSSNGNVYGGQMNYSINTALYPEIYGIETIKREIREVYDTYTEDFIGALLFKNTIWSWEKVGRAFDLDNIPFPGKQYIIYSTILDLMEDAEYTKYLVAGTRRQLGDLGVSIDNIIGRVAMKVAKYQQLKETAYQSLLGNWQFRIGTSTAGYDDVAATINRLWYDINGRYTESRFSYYQGSEPAANIDLNRRARINNPYW